MEFENYPPFDQFPPRTPAPKKGLGAGGAIAIALCCSILGGLLGAGAMLLFGGNVATQEQPASQTNISQVVEGHRENTLIDISQVDTSKVMTPAEVYAVNVGSTVGITTSVTTNFWGYKTTSAAAGSGFLYSADGYILTNYHVVEDSNAITVSMNDGRSFEAALVGFDQSNDIAVLKIEAENLVPVVLGDSDNLNVGDTVVAIGNPLGELTFSLTVGAVSALDRSVTMENGVTMNLMQTDCAINSGNSGGALFNLHGEVIGITNAKYSSSGGEASIDNIGFAIPLNSVRDIVDSIIEKGYVAKPYIGVSVTDVSEDAQRYGLPAGAVVEAIVEGSPAEAAGLQVNDIITAAGDTPITGSSDLVEIVTGCEPGDSLVLDVYRQGQTSRITLEVGENILSATQEQTQPQQQEQEQFMPQLPGGFESLIPWFNFG